MSAEILRFVPRMDEPPPPTPIRIIIEFGEKQILWLDSLADHALAPTTPDERDICLMAISNATWLLVGGVAQDYGIDPNEEIDNDDEPPTDR